MKKLTTLLATVLGLGLLTPTTAEAGHRSSRCRSYVDHCGYTVYSEYRCVGHDCHGCPIYRWVVVRRTPPCHGHGGYDGGRGYHGGGHGYHGGHGSHFSGGFTGGGVHFHWSR